MKKLLLATGQANIDLAITQKVAPKLNYEVVAGTAYKSELIDKCEEFNPDLVIVSKMLGGREISMLELLIELKQKMKNVRIIYLAGEVDEKNKEKMNEVGMLVLNGIYDIYAEQKLNLNALANLILHPVQKEGVLHFTKYLTDTSVIYKDEIIEVEEQLDEAETVENPYKHVFMVSSIKPGTGKSFISTNIATCIAKYGKKKPDGTAPKVAIIEGDLQNLSVGTLLQIEDDEYNLKTVMKKISSIITDDDKLIDNAVEIEKVNNFIKKSFKQYSKVKNLYALVGSQLKMEELSDIKPIYYIYLIESILSEFDVIIIDTNSSLVHTTTTPFLQLCNRAFYVINLDFNNVRNNTRYKDTLNSMGVLDKVSYILNQDLNPEYSELIGRPLLEKVDFDANVLADSFDVVSAVPELPTEIFNNRLFNGSPIILDTEEITLKPRIELAKVANEIWEIDNLQWLNSEYEKYKEKKFGTKKRIFFGK